MAKVEAIEFCYIRIWSAHRFQFAIGHRQIVLIYQTVPTTEVKNSINEIIED